MPLPSETPGTAPVVLLVGGQGSRLQSTVPGTAKPMAVIGGRPFLEYLLGFYVGQGFKDFVFCVGHRAEQVVSHFGDGKLWDVRIRYSFESSPLGTGGAIRNALPLISGKWFLAANGDSILDCDLEDLIRFHFKRSALASVALVKRAPDRRYGGVSIDGSGEVIRFSESCDIDPGYVNGGVYLFTKDTFAAAPTGPFSLERELLPLLVNKSFFAKVFDGFFIDMGQPEDYLELCRAPSRLNEAAFRRLSVHEFPKRWPARI